MRVRAQGDAIGVDQADLAYLTGDGPHERGVTEGGLPAAEAHEQRREVVLALLCAGGRGEGARDDEVVGDVGFNGSHDGFGARVAELDVVDLELES
jgi:hypothetical protein